MIKDKICLISPNNALRSATMNLYDVLLHEAIAHSDKYSLQPIETAAPIFLSPFDERFVTNRSPEVGLLWTGFTQNMLPYLRAQNDVASFWLVPSLAALQSLTYFWGLQEEPWDPQRIKMLEIGYPLQKFLTDEDKAKLQDVKYPTIGLWLDQDTGSHYHLKVLAFLRILNFLQDFDTTPRWFNVHILTESKDLAWKDLDIDPEKMQISVTNDLSFFTASVDYYFSLESERTIYDPLISLFNHAETVNWIYAPSRMDTMLYNSHRELGNNVTIAINGLVTPGSQGIEVAATKAATFYSMFKEQVVADFAVTHEDKA